MKREFEVVSNFQPAGDQQQAIDLLAKGVQNDLKYQTLKGITGSGKTFTMAKVIEKVQMPTLIISHNKTLAAQLYREFKEFFPNNAVEYFVSYYDYFQPEAYLPTRDLYIEKDSSINEEIEKLRMSATRSLMERNDVILVSSVSCIFGLITPEVYKKMTLTVEQGETLDIEKIKTTLIQLRYERNDVDFKRSTFRIRGDILEVYPAYDEIAYKVELEYDEVKRITRFDPVSRKTIETVDKMVLYSAKQFTMPDYMVKNALGRIRLELAERYNELLEKGKLVEAQRIKTRTEYDLEMMEEIGYCSGIENYGPILVGRERGSRPTTPIDYFPRPFLTFIDESHITVSQIGSMYMGDRGRKQTLIDYGFRLPSAIDNRPLRGDEFEHLVEKTIYVSATPRPEQIAKSSQVAYQIIRPTGLLDPQLEVRPSEGQMEDIYAEIRKRIEKNERSLILTLTKRMAEELTDYLNNLDLKVCYLHGDVETFERTEILMALRNGDYDVLIGVNLLREGIDLPEVSFIAILDADKVGFLRSATSLIQIIGRAARNAAGTVVMYADKMSPAMKEAIDETNNRRVAQIKWNTENGITPTTIKKEIQKLLSRHKAEKLSSAKIETEMLIKGHNILIPAQKKALLRALELKMLEHAKIMEFEEAAILRDEIERIKVNQF
jgi:excinuclease ABC subunit B